MKWGRRKEARLGRVVGVVVVDQGAVAPCFKPLGDSGTGGKTSWVLQEGGPWFKSHSSTIKIGEQWLPGSNPQGKVAQAARHGYLNKEVPGSSPAHPIYPGMILKTME